MEALSLLLVVVLFAAALGSVSYSPKESIPRQWQRAMQGLGLKFQRVEGLRRLWQGRFDGQLVQAVLDLTPHGDTYPVTLSTGASLAIPRSLEVYSDSTLQTLGRLVGSAERDQALGDAAFDDVAVLPNLDAYTCAALAHGARDWLLRLLRGGGWVRQGRVVLASSWSLAGSQVTLSQQLRWLCKLAGLLSVPRESLHERLARNALRDPAPGVRLTNLRFLLAPDTRTPRELVVSTARALLGDVHAPVQLLAALQLGAEGLPTLRSLLASSGAPEPVCSALSALQPEHAQPLLQSVLGCASSAHESVRAEAARVLGKWALPGAERQLTPLLSDTSPRVQLAAAQALGSFASAAAVEHLLPLAQALLDSQLRQAARAAVGRIQSRLGNVEAGRVSLAEPASLAGSVALAEPSAARRRGELSLGEDAAEAVDGSERDELQARTQR